MSQSFRINHLSGQRVRVAGRRHGEIVSVLYGADDAIVAFKVRFDATSRVERIPAKLCLILLPPLEHA